eukprot:897140-Lingulodinium_polyedra.AAC.1
MPRNSCGRHGWRKTWRGSGPISTRAINVSWRRTWFCAACWRRMSSRPASQKWPRTLPPRSGGPGSI